MRVDNVAGVNAGQILALGQGSEIPLSSLVNELLKADYVLLGETHDDPTHHALRQKLLAKMIRGGRKPAVVFEMFNREDEGLIALTTRRFPRDPDQLAAAVAWDKSGWPDWRMYRPIVKTALDGELRIVAGSLSRTRLHELITQCSSGL